MGREWERERDHVSAAAAAAAAAEATGAVKTVRIEAAQILAREIKGGAKSMKSSISIGIYTFGW